MPTILPLPIPPPPPPRFYDDGIPPLPRLCNDGLLSDEVARDVWCKLHAKITNSAMAVPCDPLSASERKLYEALTALLAARANIVACMISESKT